MDTERIRQMNREGWSRHAYDAWIAGKGAPEQVAQQLRAHPAHKLDPLQPYLGDVNGKRVMNLLGSNGKAAVSLALLGAEVTVVDISPDNARYALELARAADVRIRYIVADVMQIPDVERMAAEFDLVVMELGILHWIMDVRPFFSLVRSMLKQGGRMIVRDFHPTHRKLLNWANGAFVASGDYFDASVQEVDVPYASLLDDEKRGHLLKVAVRRWTMGEIVTSIAEADLVIRALYEESGARQRWVFPPGSPAGIEHHIPGIYTLVADAP